MIRGITRIKESINERYDVLTAIVGSGKSDSFILQTRIQKIFKIKKYEENKFWFDVSKKVTEEYRRFVLKEWSNRQIFRLKEKELNKQIKVKI